MLELKIKHADLGAIIHVLDDERRLRAVDDSGMMRACNLSAIDELSARAGKIFAAPVAQVTTIHMEEQVFNSSIGFNAKKALSRHSFCAFTIASTEDITYTLDASKDPRFSWSPWVCEEPHIRFYAGCPIYFKGYKIGTICVYDFEPRQEVTSAQIEALVSCGNDATEMVFEKQQ
ncbi:MAG: GAF domain-containing protein [Salaquimonas sp.]